METNLSQILVFFLSLFLPFHAAAALRVRAEVQQAGSAFSLVQGAQLFTFQYSTTAPHSGNWIGIYPENGGPVNQVKVEQSLVWKYAPESSGTIVIPAGTLQPGRYRAFFLAKEGYTWLASPIYVTIPAAQGSLTWNRDGDLFTFAYTATSANAKNWIGIYAQNGGPVNQEKVEPGSLMWAYAPSAQGTVHISAGSLAKGTYKAFFLANDGYKWVTNPISVEVPGIRFPVRSLTLRNARVGTAYSVKVGGLITGSAASGSRFAKVSGPAWVTVSSDGTISGTPSGGAATATVVVSATSGSETAQLTATIPVLDAGSCMVRDIRVMTMNMWLRGTNVDHYHQKQIHALLTSNVDIVALQEADSPRPRELASALGWSYSEHPSGNNVAFLSRYPISSTSTPTSRSGAVRISLDGTRQEIRVWNTHTIADKYGPYEACFEHDPPRTAAQILASEDSSGRTGQITAVVNAMAGDLSNKNNIPVLLMGDFNAPSHLDWTPALKDSHCGYDIQWPTSKVPTNAGLIDSFRAVNKDPAAVKGNTWSPIYPRHDGATGLEEPQDRIDFMYHAGSISVVSSQTWIDGYTNPKPDHKSNQWTSDHRAVLTVYRINSGTC